MRIKIGEYIYEVDEVRVRKTDIIIGTKFYQTGEQTQAIGNQLYTKGFADFTSFEVIQ